MGLKRDLEMSANTIETPTGGERLQAMTILHLRLVAFVHCSIGAERFTRSAAKSGNRSCCERYGTSTLRRSTFGVAAEHSVMGTTGRCCASTRPATTPGPSALADRHFR
jgi:hypothetical protein